jgi:uncharacterized membrane protein YkoI
VKQSGYSFRVALLLGAITSVAVSVPAFAHDAKTHHAKVAMADARATALARAPGTVLDEELEHEDGRWIYSFEIRPQGEQGKRVEEVNVDADTGVIVDVHSEND